MAPWAHDPSFDDREFDFTPPTAVPGSDDDGFRWGEPAGRDPRMWGSITLTVAPVPLSGEPPIGTRLEFTCCWDRDQKEVEWYAFDIDTNLELHGALLDHVRNHPECVRVADRSSFPPADIVVRAIDAKRRRDQESLLRV